MKTNLFKIHFKKPFTSIFFYLMCIFIFIENLRHGLEWWKFSKGSTFHLQSGIQNFSIEWSLWSASYSAGLFMLIWGIWIFWQVDQPRENGLQKLLYTKPLPYFKNTLSQLTSLILSVNILILVGLWGSNLALIFLTNYHPQIFWLLLPPIISGTIGMLFFTFFYYLISLLCSDWRVYLPILFCLTFYF